MDNLKNPFWAAGQARATREVAKRLAKKHEVIVYSSKYPGSKDYFEDGISYNHIGFGTKSSRFNNAAFILAIPLLVKNIKADVIIENFNAPISVSFSPLFTKVPVIALPTMFAAEQFSKKYHLPFHLVEKLGMKFYKYMLPYSEIGSDKAKKLNKNIIFDIVPQGVSDEYFDIVKREPKHILFLGRFDTAQKGIDLLIDAYNLVKDQIKYPLVIAGHGPDEGKINKKIKDLNLSDKIKIVGSAYGAKKTDLIKNAAFVAFPSRHDEMSVWSLEALASGLPLVCFDLPESGWITQKVALKASPFNVEEYSRLLLRASQSHLNKTMRIESRNLAKNYTWDKVIENYLSFINKVMDLEERKNLTRKSNITKTKISYILNLPTITDEASLCVAELGKHIPFKVKRLYYILNAEDRAIRGKHAHKKNIQLLFCLKGSIKIILDNGQTREEVTLDEPNKGIFLNKLMWHEMHDFKKDTVLLVLASEPFKESDYVRSYQEFLYLLNAPQKLSLNSDVKEIAAYATKLFSFSNRLNWRSR